METINYNYQKIIFAKVINPAKNLDTFIPKKRMRFTNILSNYWKSILLICVIFYLSFASPSTFKDIPAFEHQDKLAHVLVYMALAAMLIFDYKKSTPKLNVNLFTFVLTCVFFPILLGGAIEIVQTLLFYPRTASWLDWLANILGVLMGWAGMHILKMTPDFPEK